MTLSYPSSLHTVANGRMNVSDELKGNWKEMDAVYCIRANPMKAEYITNCN